METQTQAWLRETTLFTLKQHGRGFMQPSLVLHFRKGLLKTAVAFMRNVIAFVQRNIHMSFQQISQNQ